MSDKEKKIRDNSFVNPNSKGKIKNFGKFNKGGEPRRTVIDMRNDV